MTSPDFLPLIKPSNPSFPPQGGDHENAIPPLDPVLSKTDQIGSDLVDGKVDRPPDVVAPIHSIDAAASSSGTLDVRRVIVQVQQESYWKKIPEFLREMKLTESNPAEEWSVALEERYAAGTINESDLISYIKEWPLEEINGFSAFLLIIDRVAALDGLVPFIFKKIASQPEVFYEVLKDDPPAIYVLWEFFRNNQDYLKDHTEVIAPLFETLLTKDPLILIDFLLTIKNQPFVVPFLERISLDPQYHSLILDFISIVPKNLRASLQDLSHKLSQEPANFSKLNSLRLDHTSLKYLYPTSQAFKSKLNREIYLKAKKELDDLNMTVKNLISIQSKNDDFLNALSHRLKRVVLQLEMASHLTYEELVGLDQEAKAFRENIEMWCELYHASDSENQNHVYVFNLLDTHDVPRLMTAIQQIQCVGDLSAGFFEADAVNGLLNFSMIDTDEWYDKELFSHLTKIIHSEKLNFPQIIGTVLQRLGDENNSSGFYKIIQHLREFDPEIKLFFSMNRILSTEGIRAILAHYVSKGKLQLPCMVCDSIADLKKQLLKQSKGSDSKVCYIVRHYENKETYHVSTLYAEKRGGALEVVSIDSASVNPENFPTIVTFIRDIPGIELNKVVISRQIDRTNCPVFAVLDVLQISKNPTFLDDALARAKEYTGKDWNKKEYSYLEIDQIPLKMMKVAQSYEISRSYLKTTGQAHVLIRTKRNPSGETLSVIVNRFKASEIFKDRYGIYFRRKTNTKIQQTFYKFAKMLVMKSLIGSSSQSWGF